MKLKVLLIALLLLAHQTPSISATSPKAGAFCSKAGITKNYKGKKYTCIKSGKRLVWNKGVTIKQALPTATPTPAPTPTPTPTPALTPAPTPSPTPTPVPKFPDVPTMKELHPKSTYQWITFTACATRPTCWGGGVFTDDKANSLLVLTTEVLDDNHTSGTLEAHEYLHAIQQNQMRRATVWPETSEWPPSWYREGQATFAQNAAIYYQSFDLYLKNRRYTSEELIKDSTITSAWIQEFFVVDQPQSWFGKYKSWRQYDLGARMVEVLTAIKGPKSTMEIWRLVGAGLTFNAAFEKVYEISFDKALPIISKAIALDLGRS
ncbi:MAG: hypothetical protein EBY10_04565 [Actinobacteria bacterium]|nr:hypothetical protein [Actinomycetota bacterium]